MEFIDNENKLIENILVGNSDDFRILIDKYKKLVSHIVHKLVSNQTERDELGQEIFIKVYQNLSSFQYKSKLSTWIGKIAYNTCLNYLRKKKIPLYDDQIKLDKDISTVHIEKAKSNDMLPDEILMKRDISKFINAEIEKLPVQYRKAITFFHLDNMSQQEIAEIMDLPLGTVKSYIFRARKLIKDHLLSQFTREELCL